MSNGILLGVWGRKEWGGVMSPFDSANFQAEKGMIEDISFGSRRQITMIEEEVWEAVMNELSSDLPHETRRANLLLRGIKLKESKGKILLIGNCRVKILGETKPCRLMDQKHPGLKNALLPNWNGGAFGGVLDSGKVFIGDAVVWLKPDQEI